MTAQINWIFNIFHRSQPMKQLPKVRKLTPSTSYLIPFATAKRPLVSRRKAVDQLRWLNETNASDLVGFIITCLPRFFEAGTLKNEDWASIGLGKVVMIRLLTGQTPFWHARNKQGKLEMRHCRLNSRDASTDERIFVALTLNDHDLIEEAKTIPALEHAIKQYGYLLRLRVQIKADLPIYQEGTW